MKTTIYYMTNAGLYFSAGRTEILIDGIHDAAAVGFAPMGEAMQRRLDSDKGLFAGRGVLLFTHLHKDHYDAGKVRRYLERHPETALWGPYLKCRDLNGDDWNMSAGDIFGDDLNASLSRVCLDCGDFEVTAYRTRHSGESFRYIPHASFLLWNKESHEAYFVTGDAVFDRALAEQVKADCAGSANGLTAFVTAYQMLEKASRAFFKALKPASYVLVHQPPEGGEVSRNMSSINDYIHRYPPGGKVMAEPVPMSRIEMK